MISDNTLHVEIVEGSGGQLPTRGSEHSAGYDLYAPKTLMIHRKSRRSIPLGIKISIPPGYYGRIADRSGLAKNHGLTTLAGVIDQDYRGEWEVVLYNSESHNYPIQAGERIAQVVFERYGDFSIVESSKLPPTVRGDRGFGSTGL